MSELDGLPRELLRPLHRSEYDRLVQAGLFRDEHLELLYGRIVRMTLQGTRHAWVIQELNELFTRGLFGRAKVRIQMPIAISGISEPEPDLAVVPTGDYVHEHPQQAYL